MVFLLISVPGDVQSLEIHLTCAIINMFLPAQLRALNVLLINFSPK